MKGLSISRVPVSFLKEYHKVPIKFSADTIYSKEIFTGKAEDIVLKETKVAKFVKDYDSLGLPQIWAEEWDISNWCILKAELDEDFIGGAVIAYNTDNVNMLEGRDDISVLWDIRVSPENQGKGIGRALFLKAVEFAKEKNCKFLKIETQNINVNACKFYKKMGCYLGKYIINGYDDLPDEIMMLWYLNIK